MGRLAMNEPTEPTAAELAAWLHYLQSSAECETCQQGPTFCSAHQSVLLPGPNHDESARQAAALLEAQEHKLEIERLQAEIDQHTTAMWSKVQEIERLRAALEEITTIPAPPIHPLMAGLHNAQDIARKALGQLDD
jgi:hypothetical protein